MNAEIKQKWIETLLSGKYKQIKGKLRGNFDDGTEGHCCLGVLADICQDKGVIWSGRSHVIFEGVPSGGSLPITLLNYVGLTDYHERSKKASNLRETGKQDQQYYAGLNDEESYSFEMIAQEIEKNL
jgi:hypothetical protein